MGEIRQPRGTAFTIRDPLPWPDVAGIAREGAGLGYAAVFLRDTGEAFRGAGADLPVVYPVLAPGEGREAAQAVLRTMSP